MHIAILASNADTATEIQVALNDSADRYTIAVTWPEVSSSVKSKHPDLLLIERSAMARIDFTTLHSLIDSSRWPPILIVDTPVTNIKNAVDIVQRLSQTGPDSYQIGDLHIDTRRRRARLGERWVTLPPIQYRLLLALAKRTGEVVNCQELLRLVWGYEAEENEARELVKVHIRQIRRRLGLEPEKHHYIHSVRGFGYMLALPDES